MSNNMLKHLYYIYYLLIFFIIYNYFYSCCYCCCCYCHHNHFNLISPSPFLVPPNSCMTHICTVHIISDYVHDGHNLFIYFLFQSYVSCSLGMWMVGLVGIPGSIMNAIMSFSGGHIIKFTGRLPVFTFGEPSRKPIKCRTNAKPDAPHTAVS